MKFVYSLLIIGLLVMPATGEEKAAKSKQKKDAKAKVCKCLEGERCTCGEVCNCAAKAKVKTKGKLVLTFDGDKVVVEFAK